VMVLNTNAAHMV